MMRLHFSLQLVPVASTGMAVPRDASVIMVESVTQCTDPVPAQQATAEPSVSKVKAAMNSSM